MTAAKTTDTVVFYFSSTPTDPAEFHVLPLYN